MIKLGNLKVDINHTFDKEGRHVITAQIFDQETKLINRAKTTCSKSDNFNRNKGRKLAISKALTGSPVAKEERKLFWEAYRTKMTKNPRW